MSRPFALRVTGIRRIRSSPVIQHPCQCWRLSAALSFRHPIRCVPMAGARGAARIGSKAPPSATLRAGQAVRSATEGLAPITTTLDRSAMQRPVRQSLRKPSSMPAGVPANDELAEYRRQLQELATKSQEYLDKTVLTLSGGALGISFVFLKDVIGGNPVAVPNYLLTAWLLWGSSSTAVLLSYLTSCWALKKTISQLRSATVWQERPGGIWSPITSSLNLWSLGSFLAGLVFLIMFVNANFQSKGVASVTDRNATPAAAAAASAPSSAPSAPSASVTGG